MRQEPDATQTRSTACGSASTVEAEEIWRRSAMSRAVVMVACFWSPRPREILFALVIGDGGRVHSRLGGLLQDQVAVPDGQR